MQLLSHWQRPENTRLVWKQEFYENGRTAIDKKEFQKRKEKMRSQTQQSLKGLEEEVAVDKVMEEFENLNEGGIGSGRGQSIVETRNKRVLRTGGGREKITIGRNLRGKAVLKIKDSWLKKPKLKVTDHDGDGQISSEELRKGKLGNEYLVDEETLTKRAEIDEYLEKLEETVKNWEDGKDKAGNDLEEIAKMSQTELATYKKEILDEADDFEKVWTDEKWNDYALEGQFDQADDLEKRMNKLLPAIQARENVFEQQEQNEKFNAFDAEVGALESVSPKTAAERAKLKNQVTALGNRIEASDLDKSSKDKLKARLDAITAKIEAHETKIEEKKDAREKALKVLESLVGKLPTQEKIIKQMQAGTLDISKLKNSFGKVEAQFAPFEAAYPGMTVEQLTRFDAVKETFDGKYETVEQAENALEVSEKFEDRAKEEADQRAEQLKKLEADLDKAANGAMNLGEEPDLDELSETDLDTLGKIQEEHMNWQIQSEVFRHHSEALQNEGKAFHDKFVEFEEKKTEWGWSSLGAAAVVGGLGTVGFILGGPFGAAAGAWLGTKIAKVAGFGKSKEYEATKKMHEETKATFATKAPGLAGYQEQLEENAEALKASLDDSGAVKSNVADLEQAKETQLAQMKSEGVPKAFIDAVEGRFDTSITENFKTPLEVVEQDVDGGLDRSLAQNADLIVGVADIHTAINSVQVEPASIMDKTLGALGHTISGLGESMYKNEDGTSKNNWGVFKFVGGVLDGAGELVSGIGQLIEHPENLRHLFTKDGITALWHGLSAKEEREMGEGAAASGKIAFNLFAIIFGGPKRGFTKAKTIVKAPGKYAKAQLDKMAGGTGRGAKWAKGVKTRGEMVSKGSAAARGSIMKRLGKKKLSPDQLRQLSKELGKIKGPFKKVRKAAAKRSFLKKHGTAAEVGSTTTGLSRTMTSTLDDLITKRGGEVSVIKYLKGRTGTLKTRLKARQELLAEAKLAQKGKSTKPGNSNFRNDALNNSKQIPPSWQKLGNPKLIAKLEKSIAETTTKLDDIGKLEAEIAARVTPVTPVVGSGPGRVYGPEIPMKLKVKNELKGMGNRGLVVVGGQAGEQTSRIEELETTEEKAVVAAAAAAEKEKGATPKNGEAILETAEVKEFREGLGDAYYNLFQPIDVLTSSSTHLSPADRTAMYQKQRDYYKGRLKETLKDDAEITVDGDEVSLKKLIEMSEPPQKSEYSFDVNVEDVDGILKISRVTATKIG